MEDLLASWADKLVGMPLSVSRLCFRKIPWAQLTLASICMPCKVFHQSSDLTRHCTITLPTSLSERDSPQSATSAAFDWHICRCRLWTEDPGQVLSRRQVHSRQRCVRWNRERAGSFGGLRGEVFATWQGIQRHASTAARSVIFDSNARHAVQIAHAHPMLYTEKD